MNRLIAPAFAISAFVGAFVAPVGCSAQAKQEAAKDAYLAQQMDCVKQFDTRAEIDACRARVREAWGIDTSDAGKDGSR